MKGNKAFAVFKKAVCQQCRHSHLIEEDSEVFFLKCESCGNQAEQVPEWKNEEG